MDEQQWRPKDRQQTSWIFGIWNNDQDYLVEWLAAVQRQPSGRWRWNTAGYGGEEPSREHAKKAAETNVAFAKHIDR